MPVEAGQTYDAVVTAAKMTEASTGTPGLWLNFQTPADGSISHIINLTPNTAEHARKSLNNLGVTDAVLEGDEFFMDPGVYLINAECAIVTEEHEYQGNVSVRVKWINARVRRASSTAVNKAASIFRRGGFGAPAAPSNGGWGSGEPPVPF